VEAVVKSPLRTTKPSTRTRVSSSSKRGESKVLRENCDSLANKSLKKHGHILPTLPVLGVLQPAGPVRRRHWRSLRTILSSPRTILSSPRTILSSRGGKCQNPTSVKDQHTPSQAFPPGLGAPSVFPGLTGTASLCNISYSSLLTSFVKGN